MVCKTGIAAVFMELDIKQADGCMRSRGRETRRPAWMLRSGKSHWRDEQPAGGERRVGSREEPGVSRQLLRKVCGRSSSVAGGSAVPVNCC